LSQGDDPPIPDSLTETVAVQPIAELPIDWVKRLPGSNLLLEGKSYGRLLKADAQGLAVFFVGEQRASLHAARLDESGEILQQQEVPFPAGWSGGADTIIGIRGIDDGLCWRVCVRDSRLAFTAAWTTRAFEEGAAVVVQKLFFTEDLSAKPERYVLNGANDDILRDNNGDLYRLESPEDAAASLTKLDGATGKELWKLAGFEDPRLVSQETAPTLVGMQLDDGRLAIFSQPDDHLKGTFLTLVDSNGNRTPTNLGVSQGGLLFNAGNSLKYVFEQFGDIFISKISEPTFYSNVKFQRDEYTLLEPEAAAIDPAGAVYVATHSGSRLDPRPTICRTPASGGGECYTLPASAGDQVRLDGLIARENGELYIHSGFDLLHVKYPQ
jgi:hypothetical protein